MTEEQLQEIEGTLPMLRAAANQMAENAGVDYVRLHRYCDHMARLIAEVLRLRSVVGPDVHWVPYGTKVFGNYPDYYTPTPQVEGERSSVYLTPAERQKRQQEANARARNLLDAVNLKREGQEGRMDEAITLLRELMTEHFSARDGSAWVWKYVEDTALDTVAPELAQRISDLLASPTPQDKPNPPAAR